MRTDQVFAAFAAMDARTRRFALGLAAIVVTVAIVVVTMSVDASFASARENVLRQRTILDVARARAKESASLERAPAPSRIALRDAIDKALREHAVAYRRTGDAAQSDVESIVIDAVPFDVLVRALEGLARDHGVRPIEANVASRVDAGSVRAELTLAR